MGAIGAGGIASAARTRAGEKLPPGSWVGPVTVHWIGTGTFKQPPGGSRSGLGTIEDGFEDRRIAQKPGTAIQSAESRILAEGVRPLGIDDVYVMHASDFKDDKCKVDLLLTVQVYVPGITEAGPSSQDFQAKLRELAVCIESEFFDPPGVRTLKYIKNGGNENHDAIFGFQLSDPKNYTVDSLKDHWKPTGRYPFTITVAGCKAGDFVLEWTTDGNPESPKKA